MEKGAKGTWKNENVQECHKPVPLPGARAAQQGRVYLREVYGFVFGNAVGVFAGEHPAVAAVHLLWDLLQQGDTNPGVIPRGARPHVSAQRSEEPLPNEP